MSMTDPADILPTRLRNDQSIASTNDPTTTEVGENWDTAKIVDLVRRNTSVVHQPSMLLLGEREFEMLRRHLIDAFGSWVVIKDQQLYYVGMKVIQVKMPSLVKVTGQKLSPQMEHLAMKRKALAISDSKESKWFYHR